MNISREKKKEEALIRMKVIAEHFNLGDKLINYLKDDKLYYSYAYSMDTINYDERYVKIVQDFERQKNAYVYHVVEAKTQDGYRWFTKSEFGGENMTAHMRLRLHRGLCCGESVLHSSLIGQVM